MFANLRISKKLLISFSAIIVVVTGFSLIVLMALSRIDTAIILNHETDVTLDQTQSLLSKLVERQTLLRGYVASLNGEYPARIEQNQSEVAPILTDVEQRLRGSTSAVLLMPLRAAVDTFDKEAAAAIKSAGNPSTLEATRAGIDKTARLTAIRDLVSQLESAETAASHERAAQLASSLSTGRITLIVGGAATLLISIIMGFVLSRGVGRPIVAMRKSMEILADGDTSLTIPYVGRGDEIGDMAVAVEVFRANAVENRRLEQDAESQRSLTETERQRIAELERVKAEEMAQATLGLGQGLKHLADGDLTFQLRDPFAADFEVLRADFNGAVAQLADTLRTVAGAAIAIDSGSQEISTSANDLSKRTEQQAAALEETAAALDQITVNVVNSTKRTEEARKIAAQATESAVHSGRVVASAVQAMEKIEQSSVQVSNIIGVIDEIAFQTNLLALNAGVEAARAGEAGKGFAVVAQEVRELAQRSAQAAREIKDLIRTSGAEVENGVKLVSETGEALKTIQDYIVTVNQHMGSIATSAKEQSVGLAEVNTAVNQMDQVTQQNAAMVEEASAASVSLADESRKLRDRIGQFRLNDRTEDRAAVASREPQALSPARQLASKVAHAFGRTAAASQSWAEF